MLLSLLGLLYQPANVVTLDWDLALPPGHIPYYLAQHPKLRTLCQNDPTCPYQEEAGESKLCWGHEKGCEFENSYASGRIQCSGKATRWPRAQTEKEKIETIWNQGDFGFLKTRVDNMVQICGSKSNEGSNLECSDHLRYCYAQNMFFDFKSLRAKTSSNKAAELLPFESKKDFRMDEAHCDIIYDKPTIAIKLDAAVSMYHHFCDFVNLYASQHINGSFDRDINILLWDTSAYGFTDSMFGVVWEVFTSNPLIQLPHLDGKKVCFRSVMMPLLARQRFGFYYNMPVIDVCSGTGFFHAFSEHILHRLKIRQKGPDPTKVRVTILSRTTQFRRMLNEEQVLFSLKY